MTSDADGYRTIVRYDGVDYDRGLGDDAFTVGARSSAGASSGRRRRGSCEVRASRLPAGGGGTSADGGVDARRPQRVRGRPPRRSSAASSSRRCRSPTRGSSAPPEARGAKFMHGAPVLLLTTTGRKSASRAWRLDRSTWDGERLVLVASKGGMSHHPAWYLNLEANPSCGGRAAGHCAKMPMRCARATDGEGAAGRACARSTRTTTIYQARHHATFRC